ncbi:MAG: CoA-binding protein [Deltaproteobacteria bacterium]|nr:CoA-binding protein [Deltaproteobacteria bacterium]
MKNNRHDHLIMGLERLFNPKSVALVGASTTFAKWGQLISSNIIAGGYRGKLFPVNPGKEAMFGLPAFARIGDIQDTVDLAFIITPAKTVPSVLRECGDKGVKGAVIITSGFSETDQAGKALEQEIVTIGLEKGIHIIGPNTMGIIAPYADLFATGSHSRPRKGSVAFVSQSGNLGNQLTHWAEQQGIGISLFVGSGNEAMITCPDYLEYLEHDPHTRIIILYLESVGEGAHFMEVATRVNRKKPLIVLKGGRTEAGRTAAASHTGSMSGEDDIFRGACRQAGILNARVPSELLNLSAGFSSLPLPRGNRVGIVTLGGGWGVVTADECNDRGLEVPPIPDDIIAAIGRHLPPFWSKGNPVDLVGTRDLEAPIVAVEELMKWDGIDAVMILGIVGRDEFVHILIESSLKSDPDMSPAFMEQIKAMSRNYEETFISRMVEFMEAYEKPVIGVSLARTDKGTVRPVPGRRYSGVFYQTPEAGVNVLARMVEYSRLSNGDMHI